MKAFLILIVSFSFALISLGQDYPDSGFTNKAEAKNLMVNGHREGKWLRYLDSSSVLEISDTNAPFYTLFIYKEGHAVGMVREYYKSGKIYEETFLSYSSYFDKKYYENGKLEREEHYINDRKNKVVKTYYENGKLKSEVTYSQDTIISKKHYDENGNEIK